MGDDQFTDLLMNDPPPVGKVGECGNPVCFLTVKEDCEQRLRFHRFAGNAILQEGAFNAAPNGYIENQILETMLTRWLTALTDEAKRRAASD